MTLLNDVRTDEIKDAEFFEAVGRGNFNERLQENLEDVEISRAYIDDYGFVKNLGTVDPFVPIRKTPLKAYDGMKSSAYSVATEQLVKGSKNSVEHYEWKEAGTVGANYLLVPNVEVAKMADEIISESGLDLKPDRVFFNGKRFYSTYIDRVNTKEVAGVGDTLATGLMFENSYDQTKTLRVLSFMERLACSNGMITTQMSEMYQFRHNPNNIDWREDMKKVQFLLGKSGENMERMALAIQAMNRPISNKDEADIIKPIQETIGKQILGDVMIKYWSERIFTGWMLLNAFTYVLWHLKAKSLNSLSLNRIVTDHFINYFG